MAKSNLTHEARNRRSVCLSVGIAAAYNQLASLKTLLRSLPADRGLSVVVILSGELPAKPGALRAENEARRARADADPTALSAADNTAISDFLAELNCPLAVETLERSVPLRPNCVFIAAQPMALTVEQGMLRVAPLPPAGLPAPADHFLSSLADNQDQHAVGIVLADVGSDGLLGLKSINDAGGMTIVERPAEGQSASPSITHINSSGIDHVLPLADIAIELGRYFAHLCDSSQRDVDAELNKHIIEAIPTITDAVEQHTSHNFRHYKVTTLARRIKRRMQVLKQSSVNSYVGCRDFVAR